jgi:hypothetical protein
MTPLVKALFGVASVSLALSAAQFASGHDLATPLQAFSGRADQGINRAGKADRVSVRSPAVRTQTIAFTPNGLSGTSVLVRVPLRQHVREGTRPSFPLKSGQGKPMVACEPVVSVLTEIAKKLQPGRCLT